MEYIEVKKQIMDYLPGRSDFSDQDNLITLGLSSLQIMRLVNQWRKFGIKLSFGELMKTPTFEEWWNMIQGQSSDNIVNNIGKQEKMRYNNPFPLTDVQYAYWIGRGEEQVLGGVGCHAYLEFDGEGIEPKRLEQAWNVLQNHHPMLRARFLEDGMQQIMEKPYNEHIQICDYRNKMPEGIETLLLEKRNELSHRKLHIEEGEVAGICLSLISDNKSRIHFDIDLLVADVQSLQIILRDLVMAYNGENLPKCSKSWNFQEYLRKQEIDEEEYRKAKEYWQERLEQLPVGPDLPLTKHPEEIENARFNRRICYINKKEWVALQKRAAEYQTTPAMMFLSAYATILERWSINKRFLINIPLFNRRTEFDGIENAVADFTTLVLLEVNCEENPTFLSLLRSIQKQLYKDMQYSKYSGVQVQRDLAQFYGEQINVAPVVFACNLGNPLVDQQVVDTLGKFSYMISQTPQVWMDFQLYEDENGLMLTWDTIDELFPQNMIDEMMKSLDKLLKTLVLESWEQNFDVLPDGQKKFIEKQSKIGDLLEPKCLHDTFLEWSKKTPEAVALIDTGKNISVTYKELKERVLSVATALIQYKIKDEAIAITLPRGYEQIEAALAILISGNCYVPVSEGQPEERRKLIHEKTGIKYVITNEENRENLQWDETIDVFILREMEKEEILAQYPIVSPNSSAYIIMTSGSTGLPKGVEIAHKSAWNTILDINKKYQINRNDTVLGISAMDFDLSVYDIFGMLSVGGKIILIPEQESKNPDFWLKQILKYNVTIWNSVPILLEMLLVCAKARREKDISLRLGLLSGDWIPLDLPKRFYETVKNGLFVSLGGATEGSIWSNYQEVRLPLPYNWKTIPYGKPLKNQFYRIVDKFRRDCPAWVEGELWIGGNGVAKGYKGDKELTNQKFVIDKYGRWYKTGDNGRFWEGNIIEFCGRRDFQVKIKGHRIELGEIESVLNDITGIKESKVCAISHENRKNKLVAVIIKNDEKVDIEMMMNMLKKRLPEYMIPAHFLFRSDIPITSNGKVNQNELVSWISKELDKNDEESRDATDTEIGIIKIWNSIFDSNNIGVSDNFFECGGDSLSAVKMAAMIQEKMNIKISLDVIFKNCTVEKLAQKISVMLPNTNSVLISNQKERYDLFPTTEMQYVYWMGRQNVFLLGNVSSYCYYEILVKDMDVNLLEELWNALIKKHDALKLTFTKNGRQQFVIKEISYYVIKKYDFIQEKYSEEFKELIKIRKSMSQQIMDSTKWPMFDIRVSLFSENKMLIHFGVDNMIMDARSVISILNEWLFTGVYNKQNNYASNHLLFRDFVLAKLENKSTKKYLDDKIFWEKKIGQFPANPNLPLLNKPEDIKYQVFKRESGIISGDVWNKIKKMSKNRNVTLTNILLAIYAISISKVGGSRNFGLNITIDQRSEFGKEFNNVMGDFTGNILLAVKLESVTDFWQFARDIQRELLEDMNHMNFSGVEFQRELSKFDEKKYLYGMPCVYTSTLGMGNNRILGAVVYNITQTPQVWIDHQIQEMDDGVYLNWDYLEELFSTETIRLLKQEYLNVLKLVAEEENVEFFDSIEYQEGIL